jgi:hypothetical protein
LLKGLFKADFSFVKNRWGEVDCHEAGIELNQNGNLFNIDIFDKGIGDFADSSNSQAAEFHGRSNLKSTEGLVDEE